MYNAPDFVKVSTKIKDVFAPYGMCEVTIDTQMSHVGAAPCADERELMSGYLPSQCYDSFKA